MRVEWAGEHARAAAGGRRRRENLGSRRGRDRRTLGRVRLDRGDALAEEEAEEEPGGGDRRERRGGGRPHLSLGREAARPCPLLMRRWDRRPWN